MRRTMSAVVAAVVALVVPGVSSAEPAPVSTVAWGECPQNAAVPGLECGTVEVPLDYDDPDGRTIELTISRLASTNPEKRRGILLTNPGGPSPGLTFPAELKELFGMPQSVLDAYDVIGVDGRGIGSSTPVTCDLTEEQQAAGSVPPYAVTPADVRAWAEVTKKIAQQCAASETAWMLPHISTANTARDLDSIRAALGERKASFLGYSYGTYLGAVYTTLFPRTTDRVVLDSNLGAGGWDVNANRSYGRGVEDRFPDFAKWVAARPELGLGATQQEVRAKYFDIAGRLDRAPVQELTGPQFRMVTFGFTYGDATFPLLAAIWKALDTDTPLPELPDASGMDVDNLISSRLHVICSDSRWPQSVSTYQRNVAVDRVRYPLFGAAGANIQPCAFWADPAEPQVRITDRGPDNVLMVQNERDPATPLSHALSLRTAFGDRASMITVDAGGHGAYLAVKNSCADEKVTNYLLGGERPARDVTCAAQAPATE